MSIQKSDSFVKQSSQRTGYIAYLMAIVLVLALIVSPAVQAQSTTNDARSFFESLTGEWIGTCEQSTDGEKAENKYFHVLVKQINSEAYQSQFDYYRMDPNTGAPIPIGQASVVTTINPDGSVENKMTGKGVMFVDKKLKQQEHELKEMLTPSPSGGMQGQGSGKLSVHGMPLGLGKNGKIKDATSQWALNNGVLTIDQNLTASFKALVFSKKFKFAAHYTARRGTNVAKLMTAPSKVSYKP